MIFSKDKKMVKDFFSRQAKHFGDNVRALAWESDYTQSTRFQVLSEIDNLHGASILDVGCGKADLYSYLLESGINVDYYGVDMTRELIEIAKEKYPGIQLFYRDFLDDKYFPKVDYILSSGIANVRTPNNQKYMEAVIAKMFKAARKGAAINMLTSYTTARYSDPNVYCYNPDLMLKYALKLTHNVILRHDYLPNDFSLYLYKKR